MAGIDRNTGKMISGWPNVAQKLMVLYITRIGSRFMRRMVGSAIPGMLGRDLSASTILRFKTALIVATELWEPRYAITMIHSLEGTNSPEKFRQGGLALEIVGEYRPRGHLGDTTSDVLERRIVVGRGSTGQLETL